MKPHEYTTIYQLLAERNSEPPIHWYLGLSATDEIEDNGTYNRAVQAQVEVERNWYVCNQPYYTVYPVAAAALAKVTLDLPCKQIKLPQLAMLIRFIEGYEPNGIQSILVSKVSSRNEDGTEEEGLSVWVDTGVRQIAPIFFNNKPIEIKTPIFDFITFPLGHDLTVQEQINKMIERGIPTSYWGMVDSANDVVLVAAVHYVVAVSLLAEDPTMITPDVLSKDRIAYEYNPDPSIVERAIRRGKFGWIVGRDWETIPHYRRPHFALRWTGTGSTIPKIVPVKGAIVHRDTLQKVPQGYLESNTPT